MLCNRCGAPNPDDAASCSRCGHKLRTRAYASEDESAEDIPFLSGAEGPSGDGGRGRKLRKELEAWAMVLLLVLASLAAWLGYGLWPLAVAVPIVAVAAWFRRL